MPPWACGSISRTKVEKYRSTSYCKRATFSWFLKSAATFPNKNSSNPYEESRQVAAGAAPSGGDTLARTIGGTNRNNRQSVPQSESFPFEPLGDYGQWGMVWD